MRHGRQNPTFSKLGKYAYSDGAEVAEMFAEDGGATFYPAQIDELVLMLARNKDGSPAAQTIGISKPRQNGKSYAARFYAIYMADFEHRSVMYSAHHSTTTKKMFDALCNIFENEKRYPDFARDVKSITRGRGYEGIYFNDWKDEDGNYHDGGCIEFSTRTNAGARGGTYSVIIIDEAQELTDEQQEGLLPVISAASDAKDLSKMPQQIYIGTPPAPTCNGTVFARMHQAAHEGTGETWWMEWSIQNLEDITSENMIDLAYETNPAMGYRMVEKTIQGEYEQMSPDGFARERLGWWAPTITQKEAYLIPESLWDSCKSSEVRPDGKLAYGIKFSPDGAEVCLCGAVVPEEGPARVELIEKKSTSQSLTWLADWLNDRYKKASCVVIDGKNGVDVLVEKIADVWKAKGSVIRPSSRDVIASVSMLMDALNDKSVTWYEKQLALRDSATTSTKRSIGRDGFGFGGENATPIEAASLALWGARTTKRNPGKQMRIG